MDLAEKYTKNLSRKTLKVNKYICQFYFTLSCFKCINYVKYLDEPTQNHLHYLNLLKVKP